MKKLLSLIGVAALLATVSYGQSNNVPPNIVPPDSELPTPPSTNGLSFTNVNLELSSGYEYQGNVGGQSAGYVSALYDAHRGANFDLGFGGSIVFANTQDALQKVDIDGDIIKNLDTFQIVGKVIFGRQFSDNVGFYAGVGGDLNYNLTKGWGILGTSSGFTYVTGGYRFEKNFNTIKDNKFQHLVRVGVGYSF